MSTNIQIFNEAQFDIEEDLIKKCVLQTFKAKKISGDVSIALVAPSKIRDLNKKYYNKDAETDVLSFNYDKDLPAEILTQDSNYLGEVIICPSYIKKHSDDFNWELCHVVVHGVLHLLGMEHEDEESRQDVHELEKVIINNVLEGSGV